MDTPTGSKGDQIPLLAQIISVVDAYDAMTTDRPYKAASTPQWAFSELRDEVRKGWKSESLVERFVEMMSQR